MIKYDYFKNHTSRKQKRVPQPYQRRTETYGTHLSNSIIYVFSIVTEMGKSKEEPHIKQGDLWVKLSLLTICSCLVFVTSVTLAFDHVTFVHDVGHKICPYTKFCETNASMTLKDNETPCCMPCSCADDCAEINGDCCPDKALPIKKAPLAKCKAVVVKRKLGDTSSYDGYTHGVPRYRVLDTCPKDENNVSLVAECEGNKTRLDHFLWVSDFSGRTFENRFCALCNGLNNDEIVVWGLRTTCFSVLKTNLSSLEGTLLSLQCDFRLELPSKAYARPDSTCLTPNILRCNQSGLWNQHNSSIEAACKTYDSPVLSLSQDERISPTGHIVKIYKNLYCVVCNEQNLWSTNLLCPQLRPTERDPGTAFSILIDYLHIRSVIEQLQTKDEGKGHCEQEQVYDDFKVS